ncbi:arginine N-succinyltransferase [Klebsiella sp. NPDC088457]
MMVIRPVESRDLPALMALAGKSGVGLTSLPQNEDILSGRITRSQETWQGLRPRSEQGYLFVLEDADSGCVVGISALEVALGLHEPWYNFRVAPLVHASASLNVYNTLQTLFLSNDHTGCTELCTLYLDPEWRHSQNGKLLSRVRFLFLAAFRDRFAKRVVAEMRGYSDSNGRSPFWEGLGNRFFAMDFAHADYLTGIGQKAFIAELMPRYPVYIDFLPEEAKAVIGDVHPDTVPARRLLEAEGLRYRGYVDIFDGGATLEAELDELRMVKESHNVAVSIHEALVSAPAPTLLVANDSYLNYRATLAPGYFTPEGVLCLTPSTADTLEINAGDRVRVVSLNPLESL